MVHKTKVIKNVHRNELAMRLIAVALTRYQRYCSTRILKFPFLLFFLCFSEKSKNDNLSYDNDTIW